MSDDIAPVKRRRNRLYVPLDVEFATDPKILAAGPLAAYLYVCSLAYCKRSDKAGEIHREQLRVLALGLPGRPEKFAATLVSVGLWEETAEGWVISAWLKHNLSPDQLDDRKTKLREKSEQGNHQKYHVNKGIRHPDCSLCATDNPSPEGRSTVPTGTLNCPEEKRSEVEGREEKGREGKNIQSSVNSDSVAATSDDDGVLDAIVRRCASIRTERYRPADPTGYHAAICADIRRTELADIRALLTERPHFRGTPDKAAAWYELNRKPKVA